jgi:1-acyl-sn-glycerol-3-phosphate acyltransferase
VAPDRNLRILARVARLLTTPFVRYDIRGGRCASELHVGIVAVNHRSLFDVAAGLICLSHFGHQPRLLVERKYVEGRLTGRFARGLGCIPVDRQEGGGSSVDAALDVLASGVPIVIMPEGRLHWDPTNPHSTGPVRGGVSRLARAANVPVVPAALSGTERVMPAGAKVPRLNPFRRKTVVCNVADDPLWLTSDHHAANAERVMAAVRSLMV